MMENLYPDGTSIKIVVYPQLPGDGEESVSPISFTCDGALQSINSFFKVKSNNFRTNFISFFFFRAVNCSVEHVILNVACTLDDEDTVNVDKYCLRVLGLAEYLAPNTTLAQYEYVHQCIKLERDIKLAIMTRKQLKRSLARTVSQFSFL